MKKKLSALVSGVALVALLAVPVSALKVSEEDVSNKVNLSCLAGAGVDVEVAEEHVYNVLKAAEGSVVYDADAKGVDKEYLKDAYHAFDVNGEKVLVNKKTLKLYTYDSNYNLIPIR